MHPATILLLIFVFAPTLILLILKVNAALVFLSLALGYMIEQSIGDSLSSKYGNMLNQINSGSGITHNLTFKLILLLMPPVITAVLMVRTSKGIVKQLINFLPALGVGVVGTLLAVPLLPIATSSSLTSSSLWDQLLKYNQSVILLSSAVCLLTLFLQSHKGGSHKEKKRSKNPEA